MVVLPVPPRASPVFYAVSIVETDQPSSIRDVQRGRITQRVGLFHSHLCLEHDGVRPKFDFVDEQRLAMKVEPTITVTHPL